MSLLSLCFFCSEPAKNSCEFCHLCHFCEKHETLHRINDCCQPFRVDFDQEKGRVLKATRDLRPFDLVLVDKTRLFGPLGQEDEDGNCIVCLSRISEENCETLNDDNEKVEDPSLSSCCSKCHFRLCSNPTCQSLHSSTDPSKGCQKAYLF